MNNNKNALKNDNSKRYDNDVHAPSLTYHDNSDDKDRIISPSVEEKSSLEISVRIYADFFILPTFTFNDSISGVCF